MCVCGVEDSGGGGASRERQDRRARLIAHLLEEIGFQAEQNRDMVDASMGGYDQARMEKALELVGYLLVHTRQLDMGMTDEGAFEDFKSKIMKELEELGYLA